MSVPTTVQSNLVPWALSLNDITYRNVVCLKATNFTGNTPTTSEPTDCATFIGLSASTGQFDFDAVFNTTPNVTEYSGKDIIAFWNNQTLLYSKMYYPSPGGGDIFIGGQGYFTDIKVTKNIGNLIAISGTFKISGAVDLTP